MVPWACLVAGISSQLYNQSFFNRTFYGRNLLGIINLVLR